MESYVVKLLACVALTLSCGYGASFRDCAVACSSTSGCPSGFSCGDEGLCRSAGATNSCGSTASDGGADQPDAGNLGSGTDAAPRDVILSETTSSDVTESGFGCTAAPTNDCPNGVTESIPEQTAWYREFALSDFSGAPWNVTGTFQITTVHLGCWMSSANASVTITIYAYTGDLYAATLDESSLTQIGSAVVTIGPSQTFTCTDDVAIPISAPSIAAGSAFVVGVSSTDTVHDSGSPPCTITYAFRLGANGSGESRGSYVGGYCATGSPIWTTDDALIAVEGTTN
jgi:hypothetical protein